MIASAQRVVARYHAATQLQMTPGKVDSKGTESLRAMSKLYAKNRGDLSGAVISAGYYADRMGKTMYAYPGDSYGHGVWRVTYKASECLVAGVISFGSPSGLFPEAGHRLPVQVRSQARRFPFIQILNHQWLS